MLNLLRKKTKIDEEKFFIDMETTGNTVSSTIPIVLTNLLNLEKIKHVDKIMLVGFRVGLSWAATIITV